MNLFNHKNNKLIDNEVINKTNTKSRKKSIFRTVSACFLIAALGYILFTGVHMLSASLMIAAVAGVFSPVVFTGDSFLEILAGLFEGITSVISALLEMIVSFFSGLFG